MWRPRVRGGPAGAVGAMARTRLLGARSSRSTGLRRPTQPSLRLGRWPPPPLPPLPAAGRFAGPLVIGGVTRIATPDGQVGFCTEWTTGPDGAPDCAGPPDQQCVITGEPQPPAARSLSGSVRRRACPAAVGRSAPPAVRAPAATPRRCHAVHTRVHPQATTTGCRAACCCTPSRCTRPWRACRWVLDGAPGCWGRAAAARAAGGWSEQGPAAAEVGGARSGAGKQRSRAGPAQAHGEQVVLRRSTPTPRSALHSLPPDQQFVLCLGFHWVLGRNWSYDNPDLPPPAGKGQGGDAAAADDGKAAPGGAMRSDDSGGLF